MKYERYGKAVACTQYSFPHPPPVQMLVIISRRGQGLDRARSKTYIISISNTLVSTVLVNTRYVFRRGGWTWHCHCEGSEEEGCEEDVELHVEYRSVFAFGAFCFCYRKDKWSSRYVRFWIDGMCPIVCGHGRAFILVWLALEGEFVASQSTILLLGWHIAVYLVST